ncbi:MAG TPA: HYR domain-containing protein [Gaiellaceae bacterium]|nr:HYR domain-containing protein [Gaiellaceae bacterium]
MGRALPAILALAVAVAGGTLVPAASPASAAPPRPELSGTPSPWSADTGAVFSFSGSAETAGFACRLDGGAWAPCTSPVSYSGLAEGSHAFQVRARDSSGDQSPPATFGWTIDVTAPEPPSDVAAEATSPAGAVVLFSATDNLDPAPALECSHAPGSAFPLGITSVTCTAVDAAGNRSTDRSFTVSVRDTTPPTVAPRPDVLASQESPAGAVVDYALPTAQDVADPAPVVSCSPAPGSTFPVGETVVTCVATDAAGLTSQPRTFRVVVQTGPTPASPLIVALVPTLTNRTSAAFEITVGAGAAECKLDRPESPGAFTPCASGVHRYDGLVDGAHLFTVQVTNSIGNRSQASYGWTVDLTPPAAVARFAARAGDGLVRLTWTRPLDADYARVRVWRKRAGSGAWKRLADRVQKASLVDKNVRNHVRYLYRIRSLDKAGNASSANKASAWPSPILSPAFGAVVHSPPLVRWTSVRRATYYNMQLWRNGKKLMSVWPTDARFQLRSSWRFQGKRHLLAGGPVTVYVWPGFGRKADVRYGPLHGRTTFRLG